MELDSGGQMSDKSRACLMGMAEGSSKATLASCFASWRGTTEEGKVQQDLRDKYEALVSTSGEPKRKSKSRKVNQSTNF
ncbi:hypothetical protein AK812_SmicGene25714 [Symbiodinium microadriaticum]|uniref:Uncharacterized protein n=1 Tax=Symbiodinium microadriaticum TaxID=2951 RepID=A0A1Q9DBK7_SYMMI|nr:hypothetical protein AK812_SmicGene25714 [Symbiodinium microadriaticum]